MKQVILGHTIGEKSPLPFLSRVIFSSHQYTLREAFLKGRETGYHNAEERMLKGCVFCWPSLSQNHEVAALERII